MALDKWTSESADNLETNRCSVLDLNVVKRHVFSSDGCLCHDIQINGVLLCRNDAPDNSVLCGLEALSLGLDVNVEIVRVLALESESVPNLALTLFLELDDVVVLVVDVLVALEFAIGRFHLDFARITLSTQVELDHWD